MLCSLRSVSRGKQFFCVNGWWASGMCASFLLLSYSSWEKPLLNICLFCTEQLFTCCLNVRILRTFQFGWCKRCSWKSKFLQKHSFASWDVHLHMCCYFDFYPLLCLSLTCFVLLSFFFHMTLLGFIIFREIPPHCSHC